MKNLKFLILSLLVIGSACKKDDTDDSSKEPISKEVNGSTQRMLVIQTGAQSLKQGSNLDYKAVIVEKSGTTIEVEGVSWSSENENIASISSNGKLSAVSSGETFITAKVTYKEEKFEQKVPVGVFDANIPFTVLPGAIIWSTDGGPMEMFSIYLGTQSASYTYTSSDPSIASVSANSGQSVWVSFHKAGNCNITVKGTIGGKENTIIVPVLVIGPPPIPVPVVRVDVTPNIYEMIMGENKTFAAKAINGNGEDVTSQYAVKWEVVSSDENDEGADFFGPAATIDQSGKLEAKFPAMVTVKATIQGISGEAKVYIYPKKAISVEPVYAEVSAGSKKQFTASTGEFSRTSDNSIKFSIIANPSDLTWALLSSEISTLMSIGSISAAGEVTVKSNATPLSFDVVIAYSPGNPEIVEGSALITVGMEIPFPPTDPFNPTDPGENPFPDFDLKK